MNEPFDDEIFVGFVWTFLSFFAAVILYDFGYGVVGSILISPIAALLYIVVLVLVLAIGSAAIFVWLKTLGFIGIRILRVVGVVLEVIKP